MPVELPELNTYLCLQLECAGPHCRDHRGTGRRAQWRAAAATLPGRGSWRTSGMKRQGVFWATKDDQPIRVLHAVQPVPAVDRPVAAGDGAAAGGASDRPGREFWPRWPLPTVALNDPKYDGAADVARANLDQYQLPVHRGAGACRVPGPGPRAARPHAGSPVQHDDIWEYYNPETGRPSAESRADVRLVGLGVH